VVGCDAPQVTNLRLRKKWVQVVNLHRKRGRRWCTAGYQPAATEKVGAGCQPAQEAWLTVMHRRLPTCGYGKSGCRLSTCTGSEVGDDAPQVTNLRLRVGS